MEPMSTKPDAPEQSSAIWEQAARIAECADLKGSVVSAYHGPLLAGADPKNTRVTLVDLFRRKAEEAKERESPEESLSDDAQDLHARNPNISPYKCSGCGVSYLLTMSPNFCPQCGVNHRQPASALPLKVPDYWIGRTPGFRCLGCSATYTKDPRPGNCIECDCDEFYHDEPPVESRPACNDVLPAHVWGEEYRCAKSIGHKDDHADEEIEVTWGRPQRETEASIREALLAALRWNDEYKRLNHLSGDPYWVRMAKAALSPGQGTAPKTDAWLIYFADKNVKPEIFTGEGAERAARFRFEQCKQGWTCYLFRVADASGDPDFKRGEQTLFQQCAVPHGCFVEVYADVSVEAAAGRGGEGMTFWKTPNDLQVIVDAWSGRWAIVKVPFTRIEFAIFITKRRPASSGEEKVPPTKICSNSQEKEVGAN